MYIIIKMLNKKKKILLNFLEIKNKLMVIWLENYNFLNNCIHFEDLFFVIKVINYKKNRIK